MGGHELVGHARYGGNVHAVVAQEVPVEPPIPVGRFLKNACDAGPNNVAAPILGAIWRDGTVFWLPERAADVAAGPATCERCRRLVG